MSTHLPSISVILPVHNGDQYLAESIESVLSQSFQDIELIIVENASTDGTLAIARSYESRYPRVRVFHTDTPGAALALNFGMQHARADWIARMDADDIWLPQKLERQWDYIQKNPDVAVVGTYGYRIGEMGKRMSVFKAGPTTLEEFKKKREENKLIYLLSPSVMYLRTASAAAGGHDQSYAPAEDVEHWTHIADTRTIQVIPEPLVLYRIHQHSSSTSSFFTQIINAQRAVENAKRRRVGKIELSPEIFAQLRRDRPRRVRWQESLRLYSQYYYRRGGGQIAAGRYSGVGWLVLSFLLSPTLPTRRLMQQEVLQTLLGKYSKIFTSNELTS